VEVVVVVPGLGKSKNFSAHTFPALEKIALSLNLRRTSTASLVDELTVQHRYRIVQMPYIQITGVSTIIIITNRQDLQPLCVCVVERGKGRRSECKT